MPKGIWRIDANVSEASFAEYGRSLWIGIKDVSKNTLLVSTYGNFVYKQLNVQEVTTIQLSIINYTGNTISFVPHPSDYLNATRFR